MMITKNGLILILFVTLIGVALVRWAQVDGPLARQVKRLSLAEDHANRFQNQIKSDTRFHHVGLDAYTGDGGCLSVSGVVTSKTDLLELKTMLEATKPPVPVKWLVEVFDIKAELMKCEPPPPSSQGSQFEVERWTMK